jgi:hypothetical protein
MLSTLTRACPQLVLRLLLLGVKSESERERIGIGCGTQFYDAGTVRLGIHESLIV